MIPQRQPLAKHTGLRMGCFGLGRKSLNKIFICIFIITYDVLVNITIISFTLTILKEDNR